MRCGCGIKFFFLCCWLFSWKFLIYCPCGPSPFLPTHSPPSARKRSSPHPRIASFFNFSFIWSNFVLSFYEFFFLFSPWLVILFAIVCSCYEQSSRKKKSSWNISHSILPLDCFIREKKPSRNEKCTHWRKKKKRKNSTPAFHFSSCRLRNEK